MRHLALPLFRSDTRQWGPDRETLEVEDVGDGRVRLTHSPAFVDGLAYGDVILPVETGPRGYKLIERSGLLAIVVAFANPDQKHGPPGSELRALALSLSGWCEGGPGSALVLTVPPSKPFSRLEEALDAFSESVPKCTWWFGNVWDPETDELLEWMKHDS